jgi:peptide/nickel transport system substrate-binding protein
LRRRSFRALAVTATLCTVATGAPGSVASAAPPGATIPNFVVGTTFTMSNLDPTSNSYSSDVDELSLETLFRFDPQGKLERDLATSVSNPSPTKYVYTIRHGVTFWDGDPLTASDVVYSLSYERRPGSNDDYLFSSVKSVEATGPYTVVVTLAHPDASWRYSPAYADIFERKFAEDHPGTFGKPGVLVMGSGPWEVDSLDPTSGAELSANPHWWGGTVPIQHISVKIFSSPTSEALAFRAGEVDLDTYILGPKSFKATSGATILSAPSCDNAVFDIDTRSPGWDDVHVRRAVAYALNRTDIIAANGGYASPYYTLIPSQALQSLAAAAQVNAFLSSINLYPYNLAKAKAEMAESAYPHGFSAPILEYDYGDSLTIVQAISAELQAIGIRAQIKVVPLSTWAAIEFGPSAKRMTNFATGGCVDPDPSNFVGYDLGSWNVQPGGENTANYAPPEVDALLKAGIATSVAPARFAIYSKLLRQLSVDVPYVPLYLEDENAALANNFTIPGFTQYSVDGPYALNVRRR